MKLDYPGERVATTHLRILVEKAEDALEQARVAREMAERAARFRSDDTAFRSPR